MAGISQGVQPQIQKMSKKATTLEVLNATDPNRFNCVKYARTLIPSLPFGLWTIWDKKKIINSEKSKVGNIAIMKVGLPWGHVGVVTDRTGGGRYKTIQEANFRIGKITKRTGTSKDLKIIGYFDPRKKA